MVIGLLPYGGLTAAPQLWVITVRGPDGRRCPARGSGPKHPRSSDADDDQTIIRDKTSYRAYQ